jgi:predicted amidohydrolase YtcJ
VTTGSPLAAVSFMVDRRSASGQVIGGAEAIGVEDALLANTSGGAYACNIEQQTGTLSAGKHADIVVLDADPARVPRPRSPTSPW